MRLITWNCFRGECLTRAADVADLGPDLLVMPECAQPRGDFAPERVLWFGDNPRHGLGVVAGEGYRLTPLPLDTSADHSVYPFRVEGAHDFTALAVWAKPAPTYVRAITRGVDTYAALLRDGPAVMLGDFNSHACFDRGSKSTHAGLVQRLHDEFGLVSAYHAAPQRTHSPDEQPTHFWKWQPDRGFHIDYCFVPDAWRAGIASAEVVTEPAGSRRSDHRPLVVDVQPASRSVRAMAQ